MKRREYLITFNKNTSWTKYAHKTAVQSVQKFVQERANILECNFELISHESIKDNVHLCILETKLVYYCKENENKLSFVINKLS